jgi:hypothetical protein
MKSAQLAGQDRLVQRVFGEHGLAESLGGDQDDIFALVMKSTRSTIGPCRSVGQVHSKSATGLKRPRRGACSCRSRRRRARAPSSARTIVSSRTVGLQSVRTEHTKRPC